MPALRTTAIALVRDRETSPLVHGVEHLFSALGGLGLHAGVHVSIDGDELPLLDGGAVTWCRALVSLGVPPSAPRLVVAREGEIVEGASVYRFAPGDAPRVEVHVDFGDRPIARDAVWWGDGYDFASRIAVARTFVLDDEMDAMVAAGLQATAAPGSVVVITQRARLAGGVAAAPDEPARHKLLDLVGDLFLHGGPPLGHVEATRPGHAATHAIVATALREGVLARAEDR